MDPILVTAHCNKVVLVVWERGSVIQSTAAVTVREENAVRRQIPDSRIPAYLPDENSANLFPP